MKTLPFSKLRKGVLYLAAIILIGGIGYRLGESQVKLSIQNSRVVINQEPKTDGPADFSMFWDVWTKLFRYYIDAKNLEAKTLVYGAISGMVAAAGDPYTAFFPPKENKAFKDDLGGQFEGIGAELDMANGRVIIKSPLRGMPAEKAGLKPNDYILKVNGEDTTGWQVEDAVNKIRGPKGTKVTLSIGREGETAPLDISIVRSTITVPSVVSWVKKASDIAEISGLPKVNSQEAVAYIQLSRFGDNSNSDFDKAVTDVLAKEKEYGGLAGLVFDLRSNPGGYLDGAVYIASEFVKSGTIVSQENSDGSREDYPVIRSGRLLSIPVVILVNKGSASAAEIVTGALRDYNRAKVVGETTFGKGSVQTPFDLTEGASVHITTGKWLLPKGSSIAKTGITPDVVVSLDGGDIASRDAQLKAAVELLLK